MLRVMMKSKIHRATLTGTELHYEGSIAIDQDLLDQADILPGEQVQIVNLNNGERLVTYAITGERGSGIIELNGPAARLGWSWSATFSIAARVRAMPWSCSCGSKAKRRLRAVTCTCSSATTNR